MPVGTYGTVKAVTPEELRAVGRQIILGNPFHLMLRTGDKLIQQHFASLHGFMHWNGPILNDSGVFQVWSLLTLRKNTAAGGKFACPIKADLISLSTERPNE